MKKADELSPASAISLTVIGSPGAILPHASPRETTGDGDHVEATGMLKGIAFDITVTRLEGKCKLS
jgi:hypothetical protein